MLRHGKRKSVLIIPKVLNPQINNLGLKKVSQPSLVMFSSLRLLEDDVEFFALTSLPSLATRSVATAQLWKCWV